MRSLLQPWRKAALERPGDPAFLFLADGEDENEAWSFGELDRRARAIAARLQPLSAGHRVLLLFPAGLDFLSGFLGCLYSGKVAVPAYPPQSSRNLPRLQRIVQDALPGVILTTSVLRDRLRDRLRAAALEMLALRTIPVWAVEEVDSGLADEWQEPELTADDLAVLQYTSGSTSLPKGVMVSHGNLLHNEEMLRVAFCQSNSSVVVSWLPPYHDMGLIGGLLHPLYVGARCVLMSPMAFLQKPLRWLRAISRYRATTSGGPNFAYELCIRRIGKAERADLDLASWTLAFNGAEPVRAETLARFAKSFAPCGFRKQSFYPCYGLAEATLFVAGGTAGSAPREMVVDAAELTRNQVVDSSPGYPGARTLVSCGRPWNGQRVYVIAPESGLECPPGRVGEIWVEGSSVARGYWNRPDSAEFRFSAVDGRRGLRTGDLGFLAGGDLFITGRLKDLIIVRGRNHYPQDLELTAERSHPALRPGGGAAFSVEIEGEERVVLVHEVARHAGSALGEVAETVQRAIAEEHELQVYEVVLIAPGTLPKTSSGKLQRGACRNHYLEGRLEVAARTRGSRDTAPNSSAVEVDAPLAALLSALRQEVARHTGVMAEGIDLQEPLIRLGLDSLAAVELQASFGRQWGATVPLASLLGDANLLEVGHALLAGREGQAGEDRVEPEGLQPGASSPLSYGQKALWVLHHLAAHSGAYHIAAAASAVPALDAGALRCALGALARRHAVLRATFHEVEGVPVQRLDCGEPELREIDASGWTEDELERRLLDEAQRPFDLGSGPLLRVVLLRRSPAEDRLLLAMHHLIADYWSLALLARELSVLYTVEDEAGEAELPVPALSYADYVRWEQRRLAGRHGERLWNYWRERLSGSVPELDLPTDRPRPRVQTYAGATVSHDLGPTLSLQVLRLTRESGATLSSILLAAYQVLLYRYSRQRDLLVGMPTVGRRRPELAHLVGYFVNPVVVRSEVSDDASFAALLARVHATAVAAVEHGDFPFALLAERLQPERDPSRSPLFQVMFLLQGAQRFAEPALAAFALRAGGARLRLGRHVLESLSWPEQTSQFDLTLRMGEVGGSLIGSLQYNSDLFDTATAERMLGHFEVLLAAAAVDPERSIAELPLLTGGERDQILRQWSGGRGGPSAGVCLHALFEAQAERSPGATAVVDGARRWTYDELNRRANRIAHRLRRLGLGPERLVGVLMGRSAETLAALLGVIKAGAAYLFLDPSYPVGRLSFVAADAELGALLTEEHFAGKLPSLGVPEVRLEAELEAVKGEPDRNPEPWASPDNLAYVIYTSGSTGRPKGVAVAHRGPVERMRWAREAFSPELLAGVLAATSFGFDVSVFELFAPLSWGGTVILADNMLALPGLAARCEVTLVSTVPSAMAELAAGLPPAVRAVVLAGEALMPPVVERIYGQPGIERVDNIYGPTEDSIYSTFATLGRGIGRVTIGRPLSSTRAYLIDGRGELVPAGVPGELCLAGAGTARGYLGRPALTAERFLPDPFASEAGGRLYRTGDLARWLPGGEIEFLGRLDDQVKVRGFRIELGEIEAALLEHPLVREAAVVLRSTGADGPSIAAYVAPAAASAAALASHLQDRLPRYMVPASFHLLPALPRTTNGKVDRRALPSGLSMEGAFVLPRTPTEELVADVWAEALRIPRVSATDDFFRLGGHSLLAMRVASRLQSLFGVAVSLQQILQGPTVSELAAQIDGERTASRALPPLERSPRQPLPPVSFAQERLWFLNQLEPGSPAYHMAAAVKLQGDLRVDALAGAFVELVGRHEALRTSFARSDGRQVQVIAPLAGELLPVIDLEALPAPGRQEEERRLVAAEARRSFDLGKGPLLRVFLLRTAAREHVLILTLHHIVSDGWSMGVLAREVSAIYAALSQGERPVLPELAVQYADFAIWQRRWLEGGEMERQLGYWRRCLEGVPAVLELPTDRPRPPVQTFRGAQRSFRLAPAPSAALTALGRREGATLFMTLVSLSALLLSRWSNQPDIVMGTPIANRSWTEIEGVIGLFANTLPLRVRVARETGVRVLLAEVRRIALAAYAHQDLPFEKLVDDLQIARLPGRSPLFQVLVGLWNAPLREFDLPAVSASRLLLDTGTAKFELTLRFEADERGLSVQAEYARDLFDAVTIERLLAHLRVLLAGAVAVPERCLADLPLIDAGELHQLLCEWNDTARDATPACIHQLFELQAARSPDALAVEAGGERLTYRQLSDESSRLARVLRRRGVGLESRVGICLPRSVDQMVAILAALKAGGAYVPLDPAAPQERLHWILGEAGISVVVARSLRDTLPAGCVAVLPDAVEDAESLASPDDPPLPAADPENLAYILYTSGSTGRPKGVMVAHHSVMNLVAALRETVYREAGAPLRIALNAPLVFDASVKQWVQLLNGHSLHIVPDEVRPDASRLLQLLRDQGVQVLDCTPGQLSYLLAAGLLRRPGSLERVLVGGEELPRSDWSLLAPCERPGFYNVYGPTECTVDAAVVEVRSDRPVLGRPIANVRIYLLDSTLYPVPRGVPGELCIGGPGVARGYLRRPAQTAERFVPDPWAPGERIYRTGDLARQLADGALEFLGRFDHQVKVHGLRIELGEIEAVLAEHPDVSAAAVLARADELGERRLVAYVACRSGRTASASDLRVHLERRLPGYMVPAAFKVLVELPRSSNGKIDRSALATLGLAEEREGEVAPGTPLEKVLAGMMAEVLGLSPDEVGLHSNFFELGGHSMRAAELVAGLRDAFGIELPLFHVFDAPTVAGLAAVLLESPEWRQTVEEFAPALLQLAGSPAELAGAQGGER